MSDRRFLCCICGRLISGSSRLKQHLAAHDRQGVPRATVDREWHKYIDAIEARQPC